MWGDAHFRVGTSQFRSITAKRDARASKPACFLSIFSGAQWLQFKFESRVFGIKAALGVTRRELLRRDACDKIEGCA